MADTRETPVLELVKNLVDLGKEVAWHDPLVAEWNGSKSVEINWECQVAILATNQPGIEISTLIDAGVPVLDCTNSHRGKAGVVSL